MFNSTRATPHNGRVNWRGAKRNIKREIAASGKRLALIQIMTEEKAKGGVLATGCRNVRNWL